MKRPEQLYKTWRRGYAEVLAEKATPGPRKYFRASEIGGCQLAIYYAMIGMRPRPEKVKDAMVGKAGKAAHEVIQDVWGEVYRLEMVEATDEGERSLIFQEKYKDTTLEFHIRPDGKLVGMLGEDAWDGSVLFEAKSTTPWALKAARESGKWYPSWVDQVQISMHFIGPREALILQQERMFFDDAIADTEGFHTVKYSKEAVDEIFERCYDILMRVEKYEQTGELDPPKPGVICRPRGKSPYQYNRCEWNDQMVSGLNSETMCEGIRE